MSLQESAQEYGFSVAEVRELCKTNLNFLAALVLGVLFRCDFPETHLAFFEILTNDIQNLGKIKNADGSIKSFSQFAFGLPRGFCKTTLLKIYVLWVILFTDIRYILVVSKSSTLAESFIRDVCDFLDNEYIVQIFGNWRKDIERDTMDLKVFYFEHQKIVTDEKGEQKLVREDIPRILEAIGAQTAIRGTNQKNERPELIINEDIQEKECADSPTQNEAFIVWFIGTLLKCKSSFRNQTVFLGNMYNEICLLNKLRQSNQWFSFIAAGILAGKRSLWPEFRSYESLIEEFKNDMSMGHPEVFLAEVMNDPMATSQAAWDFSKIEPYPFTEVQIPDGAFITIDPATGKPKGNKTAICLHWVIDGKCVLRKIKADLWNDEKTVEEALILALTEGVSLIAVELVAYQGALLNYFNRIITDMQITGIQMVPCYPRGRSKNSRIVDYIKRLLTNLDHLHPEVRLEVLMLITRFKPLKTDNEDDELDSASYGNEVLQEHWHEITYNARTFDAQVNKAHVWSVEESSPF